MEDVVAAEADGRGGGEGFGEADHAHVVGVLLDPRGRSPAPVQTGQTLALVADSPAKMAAGMRARASLLRVRPTLLVRADDSRHRGEERRRTRLRTCTARKEDVFKGLERTPMFLGAETR